MGTSHTIQLTGLSGSTEYHYQLKSRDLAGNTRTEKDAGNIPFTFTTTDDITAPTNPTSIEGYDSSSEDNTLSSGNWYNYTNPFFRWDGASDADTSVAGYYVYWGTNNTQDPVTWQTDVTFTAPSGESGQTYYLRIKTQDSSSNTNVSAAQTLFEYKYDITDPTSSIVTPSDGDYTNASPLAISGIYADTYSNVNSVEVSVKRNSDNKYWSGSDFTSDTEVFVGTTLTTSWSYEIDSSNLTSGVSYTARSKAYDNAQNTQTPADGVTFTYDSTQAVISNLSKDTTLTSVTITWITDEDTTTQVEYWIPAEGHQFTTKDTDLTSTHTVVINSLAENTTYNFKALSDDAAGNESESQDDFITTKNPTINSSSIQTEDVTIGQDVKTRISWVSDENATSYIDYGLTSSYGLSKGSEELETSHQITLADLLPLTTYYFRTRSMNAQGNEITATTISGTFITPAIDTTAPAITFDPDVNVTAGVSSAVISWTTDENATSTINYGTTSNYDKDMGSGSENETQSHQVTLTDLTPSTTYHFKVKSSDISKNTTQTSDYTFTTSPFIISNVTASAKSTIATVTWNTNVSSDSLIEYRTGGAAESKVTGSADEVTSHSVNLTDLVPGTIYSYIAKSKDTDGNIIQSALMTFTTPAYDTDIFATPPSVSSLEETDVTATTARIVWITSVATTSWVDYGETEAYGSSEGENIYNTSHVIILTGLTPGTTYHYRVRGEDVNRREYYSPDYTFTALIMPSISNVNVSDIKTDEVTITCTTNTKTDMVVKYSKDTSYDKSQGNPELTTDHFLVLEGLEDNTSYHFVIESKDSHGNITSSSDSTFSTIIDTVGPQISQIKTEVVASSDEEGGITVIISWTTDEASTSQIEYSEGAVSETYQKSTHEDATLNVSHTVVVTDLEPSVTYHFRAVSKDKSNNISKSEDFTVITPAKTQTVLQLIIKRLEEAFSWLKNLFTYLGDKVRDLFNYIR